MSLLNDMLRDLSQQQSHAALTENATTPATELHNQFEVDTQEQHELLNRTRAAKPLPTSFVPSMVVFFLVLAALLIWQFLHVPKADISSTNELSGTARSGNALSGNTLDASASETIHSEVIANKIADEGVNRRTADTVEIVPALDERLQALEAAVTTLSTSLKDVNQRAAAESTGSVAEAPINSSAQTLSQERTNTVVDTNASVSIKDPFVEASAEVPVAAGHESVDVQALTSEPVHLDITPNPKWQDEQVMADAQVLIEQGQVSIAQEKLQHFIAQAAQPLESLKLLLAILSEQEDVTAMQLLMAQADYLPASVHYYYAAKIALIQQNESLAIQLLEAHLSDAEQDENYRALLAGLYQKTGKSLEAANHYRRLLSVFGDKPAYWLGYALAQDALDQTHSALQAYQRVNQYSNLQPQVRNYIQLRLTALQH
jgi:MSHA biogenesis protein MshN